MKVNQDRVLKIIYKIVNDNLDVVIDELMKRFDEEIIPYEDEEDPARPSLFKNEFEQFLRNYTKAEIISSKTIQITIDDEQLGLDEELDPWTQDGLKIIGTIIKGIVGNYILVTSNMTGEPEGRFGRAFLLPERQYRLEAPSKGWDPDKPVWKFSNFPGIPDFFQVDISALMDKIMRSLGGK